MMYRVQKMERLCLIIQPIPTKASTRYVSTILICLKLRYLQKLSILILMCIELDGKNIGTDNWNSFLFFILPICLAVFTLKSICKKDIN